MQNLNFGSFCETKSGFNFFAGSFFETKSGFKLYFGSLVGFFFEIYQELKIAVFWPKFTITGVSMKPGHKKKTTKTITKSVKPLLVSQKLTNVKLETTFGFKKTD